MQFQVLAAHQTCWADLYVVLFQGGFITAQPGVSKKGNAMLFPLHWRGRTGETLDTLGYTRFNGCWASSSGISLQGVPMALVLYTV
ncbi:hypothetical protein DXT99_01260 [Pontibacter diazotrophicus]|uniref:Uncharacterized protein n=1 Tax=Pontibacter diazotrophicus TaxID=1400979 RepID=A0A3D8LI95_9BACT|nr:hypothetical protein DXT99_01260 [Pontibacter diazotrophicus]